MTRVDLHSHTRYSDGTSTPAEIAQSAKQAGLDVLCLTDHNSNTGPAAYPGARGGESELHAVAQALLDVGVQPIIGCEYSTAQGHLLIYGLDVPALSWGMYPQMQDVIDDVNRLGGACIVPHAFHGYQRAIKGEVIKLHGLVALEGWNGRVERSNPGENRMARAAAEAMGLPVTAATDAHNASELGGCWIDMPCDIRSSADLVAALQRGAWTTHVDEARFQRYRDRILPRLLPEARVVTAKAKPKHARVKNPDGSWRTVCGVRYVDGSAAGSVGGATSWTSEVTCRRCNAGWLDARRSERNPVPEAIDRRADGVHDDLFPEHWRK